jgi:hypothetical protein
MILLFLMKQSRVLWFVAFFFLSGVSLVLAGGVFLERCGRAPSADNVALAILHAQAQHNRGTERVTARYWPCLGHRGA